MLPAELFVFTVCWLRLEAQIILFDLGKVHSGTANVESLETSLPGTSVSVLGHSNVP